MLEHPNLPWAKSTLLAAHPTTTEGELNTLRWDSLMGCYLVQWKGMLLGIETDGHIHS
jgi:hypothetical protein